MEEARRAPMSTAMAAAAGNLFVLVFMIWLPASCCYTDPRDAAALRSLMDQMANTPPSWGDGDDPCGFPWEGVMCDDNSRVTALKLSTMGLKGTLSGDIGQITELQSLDLSYNKELGGPLTPNIASLNKLTTLILAGCQFTGSIPDEIGKLPRLYYLALNRNNFTGQIPPSMGGLSKLYWFDVADNQLTGPLPLSSKNAPGLDQLVHTKHFHFNKNRLSGSIPEKLFSSEMSLIHLLLDGNRFEGRIPDSIGLVQTLEVLRLDKNVFSGPVPSSLNNLTRMNELNLANNKLTGPLPDLTGMNSLNYVDLSNNTFDPSESPAWFVKLPMITTLVIEQGGIHGEVPQQLFGLDQLQAVILNNNAFNGTLDMGSSIGQQLQIVNFKNNAITSVTLSSSYNNSLMLAGNPVCASEFSNTIYCIDGQEEGSPPYSTRLTQCGPVSCPSDQSLSPQSCSCSYPYQGVMVFRAPFFRDISNSTVFQSLESDLWTKLGLSPGSVSLQNPFFDSDSYLQLQLKLFPSAGMYFNRSEILRIGFDLSNQTYKPPSMFGPYYFIASPYPFPVHGDSSSMSAAAIIGIASGSAVLVLGLIALGLYAYQQRKKALRAVELSKPFVSWAPNSGDGGSSGAPQLKGARLFTFDELKKCTNGFSEINEIGVGGYGKVYRGMRSDSQFVAIKRAQKGSMQGGLEFKTEIELLSRVHHKNLVGLVGFCFERGEQMLVYELIPNGTLRETLSGKSGIQLDWKRRLRIALGSARGLAYLHELANPPIIHRDVKSSNILLDENLAAKVADFGLSKLISDREKGHISTQVKGTLGYLDPEYYMTQQLTEKSDVYSFGVVMLELLTGRQPIEMGRYIVREVKLAVGQSDDGDYYRGLKGMIDPAMAAAESPPPAGFGRFVGLALRCTEESAASRPAMSEVVKAIEAILHDEGMQTASTSASSSATDFVASAGAGKGAAAPPRRHPYMDPSPAELEEEEEEGGGAFSYSGKYLFSTRPEPK